MSGFVVFALVLLALALIPAMVALGMAIGDWLDRGHAD